MTTADERLIADHLAQLEAAAWRPGEQHDSRATAAYLERLILSRLTAVQAAAIVRHMAHEAIEQFGSRRGEHTAATGSAMKLRDSGDRVAAVLRTAWEHTWPATPHRLRRHAANAGVSVPGGKYFWDEGHFSYLGRRHLARRHGATG